LFGVEFGGSSGVSPPYCRRTERRRTPPNTTEHRRTPPNTTERRRTPPNRTERDRTPRRPTSSRATRIGRSPLSIQRLPVRVRSPSLRIVLSSPDSYSGELDPDNQKPPGATRGSGGREAVGRWALPESGLSQSGPRFSRAITLASIPGFPRPVRGFCGTRVLVKHYMLWPAIWQIKM